MSVMFLLCGPWADLYLFMGCAVNSFPSIMLRFTEGWEPQQSGPTDPPKENGHNFAPPMAPVASKSRLRNRRCFPFVIVLQDAFASRTNQRSPISQRNLCNLSSLKPLTEPWFELLVTIER